MNRETLSITPDATHNPSIQEGFSDIDMQLLQAHNQLATQVETLAVDPSLSAEEAQQKNEAIFRAVGAMSLATEGLDYDTMKYQTEVNYNAYVAEQINRQSAEATRKAVDDANDSEDERPRRRKHRTLFAFR